MRGLTRGAGREGASVGRVTSTRGVEAKDIFNGTFCRSHGITGVLSAKNCNRTMNQVQNRCENRYQNGTDPFFTLQPSESKGLSKREKLRIGDGDHWNCRNLATSSRNRRNNQHLVSFLEAV